MRTKALLLSAALVAAGVASSMAQTSNVYSLNIVGYVNVPLQTGFNLIAQQLDVDGVDNVNTVLTNGISDGTLLFTFNGTGFNTPIQFIQAGGGWFDSTFSPATNNFPPGSAFFLLSPSNSTVTLVGQVSSSTNHTTVSPGFNFLAVVPPLASDLDTNGFPAVDGMFFQTFVNGAYTTPVQFIAAGNGWFDSTFTQVFPTPSVAQGFLILNPANTSSTWTQTFTVQ